MTRIEKLSTIYNLTEIYINSRMSELEDINLKSEPKPLGPEPNITFKVSKIKNTGFDFNKICKLCIENKQT